MTTLRKGVLFFSMMIMLLGSITIWIFQSPLVEDYYLMYYRSDLTFASLPLAFTVALRRNHPVAYHLTSSAAHPALDQWMKIHKPQYCESKAYLMLGGGGTEIGRKVIYGCTNADPDIKDYALTVDNIVIEDNTIIDWGPVKEEINQR